jgi:uncharacterized protein
MIQVTIYSKPGCHLCEDVEAMVQTLRQKRRFSLEIRNILDDPADLEQYQYAIPVITLNGREIGRYRLSAASFEQALQQGQLAVVVMAKHPQPGRVKTRLQGSLSPEQAAEVQRVFVQHMIGRLSRLAPASLVTYVDPPDAAEAVSQLLLEHDIEVCPQVPGDLGARLAGAAQAALRRWPRVLLMGVDSPDIPANALFDAAGKCAEADVVLGPTLDGGYWCLGLTGAVDASSLLDGIAWSTGDEYQQTLDRTHRLGLKVAVASQWSDVDHPQDLASLIQRLEQSSDCDDKRLLQALSFLPAGVI